VWPHSRLSTDEVIRKFRNCASYSRTKIDPAALDSFIEAVLSLETLPDVASLLGDLQK